MSKKLLTVVVDEQEFRYLDEHCARSGKTRTDVIRDCLRALASPSDNALHAEIVRLSQEVAALKQEKTDLEILLEMTTEHSDTVEDELHHQAVEALRQSEEWFRTIAEATPTPILICRTSEAGTILYANAMASNAFGLPVDELVGRPVIDFYLNPAERLQTLTLIQQTGQIQNCEIQLRRADDTPFWVTASLRQLTFNGEPTTLSALFDISDRKRAEDALQQAKDQLEAVLEAVPGSISWVDTHGHYLGVNPYLAAQFNLTPDAFIGQRLGFLGGDFKFADFMNEFLASSRLAASQTVEIHINDQLYHYLIAARKYQRGMAAISVGIDVTKRKHAEDALRLAEAKYRGIFENAIEGIFQSTPDGRYISVNPAMARLFGYDSTDDMMATVNEIGRQIYVNPGCRDRLRAIIETQGEIHGFECQAYCKDGNIIWISESTRAVYDIRGDLLYFEGIVEDITERKQAEETLRRQVKELRIEIDQGKRANQVAEITQTDYFQQLQAEVEQLRHADDGDWSF
ncbi:MAG: PAS domain S-box protein [Elainellaceae cyanobacterium]